MMNHRHGKTNRGVAWLFVAALFVLCDCQQNLEVKPPPAPRRPKAIKAKKTVKADTRRDCEPTDPRSLPPSVAYPQRSIDESKSLANQGFNKLQRAEDPNVPRIEREELITDAVDLFITALRSDPYNVHATYNLAAAYARIDRPQCSINLLERLFNLRKLRSQKAAVELKLDRLLGRGEFRRKLDPDFRKMRDMAIFRDLVKRFCPPLSADATYEQCR
ncbi:MAG: hypothetical protein MJE77_10510 [Proteobacteria bacterium]|nr:hypothetical protein [Pseudomonadota bacterium]